MKKISLHPFLLQHRVKMWMLYIRAFLLNLQDIRLSSLSQQHELVNIVSEFAGVLNDDELVERWKVLHEQFFMTIKNIINLKHEGRMDDAFDNYTELEKHTEQMLSEISEKENEILSAAKLE